MRILFWSLLIAFSLFGLLALGLLKTEEAGMAMIFFLPLCGINVVSGLGAGAISRFKASYLNSVEQRVGSAAGMLALITLIVLIVTLIME